MTPIRLRPTPRSALGVILLLVAPLPSGLSAQERSPLRAMEIQTFQELVLNGRRTAAAAFLNEHLRDLPPTTRALFQIATLPPISRVPAWLELAEANPDSPIADLAVAAAAHVVFGWPWSREYSPITVAGSSPPEEREPAADFFGAGNGPTTHRWIRKMRVSLRRRMKAVDRDLDACRSTEELLRDWVGYPVRFTVQEPTDFTVPAAQKEGVHIRFTRTAPSWRSRDGADAEIDAVSNEIFVPSGSRAVRIAAPPPGEYRFEIESEDATAVGRATVSVTDLDIATLRLRDDLVVAVCYAGRPVSGAKLYLSADDESTASVTATTDDAGVAAMAISEDSSTLRIEHGGRYGRIEIDGWWMHHDDRTDALAHLALDRPFYRPRDVVRGRIVLRSIRRRSAESRPGATDDAISAASTAGRSVALSITVPAPIDRNLIITGRTDADGVCVFETALPSALPAGVYPVLMKLEGEAVRFVGELDVANAAGTMDVVTARPLETRRNYASGLIEAPERIYVDEPFRIDFRGPAFGAVLATLGRRSPFASALIALDAAGRGTWTITAPAAAWPEVTIGAVTVGESDPRSEMVRRVRVERRSDRLAVAVERVDEPTVQDSTTEFTITIRDHAGRPSAAIACVGVVDEAAFDARPDRTPDLCASLAPWEDAIDCLRRRSTANRSASALFGEFLCDGLVHEQNTWSSRGSNCGSGWTQGSRPPEECRFITPDFDDAEPRGSPFSPAVFFSGKLHTDGDGRLSIRCRAPTHPTRLRVTVFAVSSDGATGEFRAWIPVGGPSTRPETATTPTAPRNAWTTKGAILASLRKAAAPTPAEDRPTSSRTPDVNAGESFDEEIRRLRLMAETEDAGRPNPEQDAALERARDALTEAYATASDRTFLAASVDMEALGPQPSATVKARRLRVLDAFLVRRARTRTQETVAEGGDTAASDIAGAIANELFQILHAMKGSVEPTDSPLPRLAATIAQDGRLREEAYLALSSAGRAAVDVGALEAAFAAERDSTWLNRLAAHPEGRASARADIVRELREPSPSLSTYDLLQADAAGVFAALSASSTPQLLERLGFEGLLNDAAIAVVEEVVRRAEADPDGECARYAKHSAAVVPTADGDGPARAIRAAFRFVLEIRQDPIAVVPFLGRRGSKAALRDGLEAWSHTIVFETCLRMLEQDSEPRPLARVTIEGLVDRLPAVDFDVFDLIEEELKLRAAEAEADAAVADAVAVAARVRAERTAAASREPLGDDLYDVQSAILRRVENYGLQAGAGRDPRAEAALRRLLITAGLAEPR